MLLKPRPHRRPIQRKLQVGCAFCWEWVPQPQRVSAYSPDGALGGRCECGAFYVVDETGKLGGQALLDITTMACDGDTERALKLESDVHYELRAKPLVERDPRQASGGPALRASLAARPKVWFLKLKPPVDE